MKLMSTLAFLGLYMAVVMSYKWVTTVVLACLALALISSSLSLVMPTMQPLDSTCTRRDVRRGATQGGAPYRAMHTFFCVFALGNVLEGLEVLTMRYRNSAGARRMPQVLCIPSFSLQRDACQGGQLEGLLP